LKLELAARRDSKTSTREFAALPPEKTTMLPLRGLLFETELRREPVGVGVVVVVVVRKPLVAM